MVDSLTAAIGLLYEKRQRTTWLVDSHFAQSGWLPGCPETPKRQLNRWVQWNLLDAMA
jgi:hypothetical protein